MLFDIAVAAFIMLCGVAVYFALLGLIILYNKISAGNTFTEPQKSIIITEEPEEVRPDGFERYKEKIQLNKLTKQLKKIQLGKFVQHIMEKRPHKLLGNKNEKPEMDDPLRLEHKKREEEFRLKMQQRNEELLQELKQRREDSRLAQEQGAVAESQNEIPSTDEI